MPKNSLPTVSSDIPKDLRYFIDRVAEVLTTNGPNQFLTLDELKKGSYNDALDESGGTGGGDDDDVVIPVFCPPKASNLLATGGYEYIILEWDRPTYYGHAFTRVFRASGDTTDFSQAQLVTSVEGRAAVFSDYLGTGQTATYWVQFVNINGEDCDVISDRATASTAINVEEVIEALEGALTSTEFVDDLSTFLDNAPDNYVVKLSGSDGAAAGFGLASTPSIDGGGGVEFTFAVLADNFFITPPVDFNQAATPTATALGQVWRKNDEDPVEYYLWNGAAWEGFGPAPFIVRTTPTTITEGGEVIDVPAGVYIRDGFIQNGTITNAKIGTAAIDRAKIADATIVDAKIGYLDAGKIQTGEFQSFDFSNEAGKAGFRLAMNTRPIFNQGTGDFEGVEFITNQEDIEFILRGALDQSPALQLIGGEVTINALNLREKLESIDWPASGFQFDIETGVYQFKDGSGNVIFTTNGFDGNAIETAIQDTLSDLNAEIQARATQTAFNSLLDTVNDTTSGLATKAPLVDLQDTNDAVSETNTNLNTLNTNLDSVRDPDTGLLDPSKLIVDVVNNDAQLLSDLQFLLPFAEEADLDLFFNKAAFAQLIAGTLISDQAFVNTGNFDTVLTDTVLANNGTIDNLLVNTLQIADNAVFVPVTAPAASATFGGSYVRVATSAPITWGSAAEKPSAVVIVGTLNFLASISSSDAVTLNLRVGLQYNSNNAVSWVSNVGVSTRKDFSQSLAASGLAIVGNTNNTTGVSVVMEARTTAGAGFSAGGGSVTGFAGKR